MKCWTIVSLAVIPIAIYSNCRICIEPKWNSIECSSHKEKQFGSKLILVGTITVHKHCKECIKINKLVLSWHGKMIDQLCGSLYKKLPGKEFRPLQENVICDTMWNKTTQNLILEFDAAQTLHTVTTFYLVLTVSAELESLLKQGHFELKKTGLPDQITFQEYKLDLALAATPH